ncbi:conserved hypothetical protein, membrane, partial [human gut metagenome]
AAKNPATDIYVERGLAKVTLGTGTTTEKTVTSDTYQGDKVTISKWALDVTNKKAYPIHNVDGLNEDYTEIWNNNATTSSSINGANTQRFVDNNTATLAKRVYWGIDPNYNDNSLCTLGEAGKTAREKEFNYVTANICLLGILLVLVEMSITNYIDIFNVSFNLLTIYITIISLYLDETDASIIGAIIGLVKDIVVGGIFGVNALILFTIGYGISFLKIKYIKKAI